MIPKDTRHAIEEQEAATDIDRLWLRHQNAIRNTATGKALGRTLSELRTLRYVLATIRTMAEQAPPTDDRASIIAGMCDGALGTTILEIDEPKE